MKLLGAILAGGQARRFGADKALALLDGATLIERAIAAIDAQTDAIVVCGRTMAGRTCVADRPAAGLGPLGGLNAALRHAADHGFDAVLSAPCDTPFLPADLARRLMAAGGAAYAAGLPVVGLWPAALADALDGHLGASTERSMRGWIATIGAVAVDLGAPANINTPADLAALAESVRSAAKFS